MYRFFLIYFVHLFHFLFSLFQFLLYIHNFIFLKGWWCFFFRNKHAYFFLFTFLHSHFLFLKYALLILSALEKVDDYEFKVLLDLILFFVVILSKLVSSHNHFSFDYHVCLFFSLFLWKEDIIATTSVNTVTEEILDIVCFKEGRMIIVFFVWVGSFFKTGGQAVVTNNLRRVVVLKRY